MGFTGLMMLGFGGVCNTKNACICFALKELPEGLEVRPDPKPGTEA